MIGAIILQALLIFVNATFASAEIAVISMKDTRLKHLASEGNKNAQKLCTLTEQPAKFLATIQVAITLAGLLGGAFAADNFAEPLADYLLSLGIPVPRTVVHSVVLVLVTLLLTYFSLVFGELVPKRIAMKKAEALALKMAGILNGVSKLCAPLVWLLTISTNFCLHLVGINPMEKDDLVTEEDIRLMLAEGNEQGTIQKEESWMIQNIFEFDDTSVGQVSTHKREVTVLYLEDSNEEWEQTIHDSRFTYYPILGESHDDVVGILDTKVYFRSDNKDREYIMEHAVDKPFFVPEEMRANDLFNKMKQTREYFAVVLDEYGSMFGIVTIHDLIEELVGDLEDDEAPPKPEAIEQIDEDTWMIQGDTNLEDVADYFHVTLPIETYDTFSGFICEIINRVPEEGEHFSCESNGLKIEVMNVKNHTVDYALVKESDPPAQEPEE
ncbi:MAG: hemolysin family protein [Eubacteriales bacterium]|nr:hemolysin family protein [Eubacteriales bacterium]